MKSFIIFLLFVGIILLIDGIYKQKLENQKQTVKTEYRFIPRSYYDSAFDEYEVTAMNKNMFGKEGDPWFQRNVGVDIE